MNDTGMSALPTFKKLAGLGRAHKNGAFFLPSFFFCASCAKRKSGIVDFLFFAGEELFIVVLCTQMVFCKKSKVSS